MKSSKTTLWYVGYKFNGGQIIVKVKKSPFTEYPLNISFQRIRTISPNAAARKFIKYTLFEKFAKAELSDNWCPIGWNVDINHSPEVKQDFIRIKKKTEESYRGRVVIEVDKT